MLYEQKDIGLYLSIGMSHPFYSLSCTLDNTNGIYDMIVCETYSL
jgi:hypothetical protein